MTAPATKLSLQDSPFWQDKCYVMMPCWSRSLGTQITMLQCTIAGGRTKAATEKSFVFVHKHGGYAVT